MKKMGAGRNIAAAAKVAFALMAPAVAGCAPNPRAPASEACTFPGATVGELRTVVEGAIAGISGLYGTLFGRLKEVKGELAALDGEACQSAAVRFLRDEQIPFAEGAISSMGRRMENLANGLSEAEGDAGRMRVLARVACMMQETAEVTFTSIMGILEDASGCILAARGKE